MKNIHIIIIVAATLVIAFLAFKLGQNSRKDSLPQMELVQQSTDSLTIAAEALYNEVNELKLSIEGFSMAFDEFQSDQDSILAKALANTRATNAKVSNFITLAQGQEKKMNELRELALKFEE